MNGNLTLPIDAIRAFCEQRPIRRLALFGSVLRDDFTGESDVDVLVEFEPDSGIGYFELVAMRDELSAIIGQPVDLRTPAELSRYFRQQVLDTAQALYGRN